MSFGGKAKEEEEKTRGLIAKIEKALKGGGQ